MITEETVPVKGEIRRIWIQLAFWSCIGVLIRIGVQDLHKNALSPNISFLYPQIVGCTIMGWLISVFEKAPDLRRYKCDGLIFTNLDYPYI